MQTDYLRDLESYVSQDLEIGIALERLGEEEIGSGASISDYGRVGKRVLKSVLSETKMTLCSSNKIKKACIDADTTNLLTAAALICGALESVIVSKVNIALVGYIIARTGMKKICSDQWG